VRGGGICLTGGVSGNTVEANVASGSPGDGISVQAINAGPPNVIRRNTSVENAGCDINDHSTPYITDTWEDNRFGTQCGTAGG